MCSRGLHTHGKYISRHFLQLQWMRSKQIYKEAVQPVQRLHLQALSNNTLLVFQESVLWLACLFGAVAYRKLAFPAGAVCFTPLTSHRNCVLPKTTHLLNEFPSAPVWYALLPGTPLFNWCVCPPQQPTVSLESCKVVKLLSEGQEDDQCVSVWVCILCVRS